ncbi:helix-turn-helix transcriptional regulator [Flavitalea sp.]|nr:WYL domain-containing protein [Flavitalea sp.]
MPVNRNALIRYKTIDACLRNRRKKWTLEKLIDAVSDALYELEGIDKGISKRTIQADMQMMRSDKLGYNAPIIVLEKKYYTYEDAGYSITRIPLSDQDLARMNEAVEMLRQFKGFSHFSDLNEVVQKLEDHVYAAAHQTEPVIDFEKNEQLKGLEFLEPLYNAIIQRKSLQIKYCSFKAREAAVFQFHVWWLKEFKNRWFCVGVKKKDGSLLTLALDRMETLSVDEVEPYIPNKNLSVEQYYRDVIGVTVSENLRKQIVKIFVNHENAPYVQTKPLHVSQELIERRDDGIVIAIKVQLNFELEKEILGFGDGMVVLEPERLRKRVNDRLIRAVGLYTLLSHSPGSQDQI